MLFTGEYYMKIYTKDKKNESSRLSTNIVKMGREPFTKGQAHMEQIIQNKAKAQVP